MDAGSYRYKDNISDHPPKQANPTNEQPKFSEQLLRGMERTRSGSNGGSTSSDFMPIDEAWTK
jgi:hypothetical protein